jgi:hypothetical protein
LRGFRFEPFERDITDDKKVVPSFRRISGLARAGLAIFRDAGLAIDRDTREIAMAWSG